MNYTKKQRHTIYKKVLALIQERREKNIEYGFFICWFLAETLGIEWYCGCGDVLLPLFPEIEAKRPPDRKNHSSFYNSNEYKKRVVLMKKCITETT